MGDGRHAHVVHALAPGSPRRRVAHRGRQDRARDRLAEHARGLRHPRPADRRSVFRRAHAAKRDGLDGLGPAEQQSAVSEPVRRQRPSQLFVDRRPPHAEERLRVPVDQHRRRRRASEVRSRCLRGTIQPSHWRGRGPRHLQPRRFHGGRSQHLRTGQPVRVPPAPAHALRVSAGRLAALAVAHLQPRRCATNLRRRSGRPTTT